MKRIFLLTFLILALTACRSQIEIRPDTIVDIPLDPTWSIQTPDTEPVTETPTEAPTEKPTEATTEKPTEPPTEKPTEKPKKEGSGKDQQTTRPTEKATQPPTAPPTQPPTEPPTEPPAKTQPPVITDYVPTDLDYAMVEAINTRRAEAGLSPLALSAPLSTAAARRCVELSALWGHTRPDGTAFTTVLEEVGIYTSNATESPYYTGGIPDARSVTDLWMNYDSYRSNLLLESAAFIGAAHWEWEGITYIDVLIIG